MTSPNFSLCVTLWRAAASGSAEAVAAALAAGAGLHERNLSDATAVVVAAKSGSVETLRFLLDAGARVDDQDIDRRSALIWSALRNNRAGVDLLLARGADVRLRACDGWTALMAAAAEGAGDVIEPLWRADQRMTPPPTHMPTALWFAVQSRSDGAAATVRALLACDASLRRDRAHLSSCLAKAAEVCLSPDRVDVLRALLEAGAAPDGPALTETTPLMVLADRGGTAGVQLLLEAGADWRRADSSGRTAEQRAYGHAACAVALRAARERADLEAVAGRRDDMVEGTDSARHAPGRKM